MTNVETVAELIARMQVHLSPSEKKISRALLSDYPSAGLGTTATLAKASNTSAPTVVRFAARLGFSSFNALQAALRSELTARAKSPALRAAEELALDDEPDAFTKGGRQRAALVQDTFDRLQGHAVENVVSWLAVDSNQVLLAGGHYTSMIARIAALQLSKVRPGVRFVDDISSRQLAAVYDLRPDDVMILFDVRRYEPTFPDIAELAAQRGANIVLVTDQWLSPVSAHADVVLQANVDVSFFDSLVGCLALAEALVHETATRLDSALGRLEQLERLRHGVRES